MSECVSPKSCLSNGIDPGGMIELTDLNQKGDCQGYCGSKGQGGACEHSAYQKEKH